LPCSGGTKTMKRILVSAPGAFFADIPLHFSVDPRHFPGVPSGGRTIYSSSARNPFSRLMGRAVAISSSFAFHALVVSPPFLSTLTFHTNFAHGIPVWLDVFQYSPLITLIGPPFPSSPPSSSPVVTSSFLDFLFCFE